MVRKIIMAAAIGVCAAVYADEPVFEVKGVEISGYLDMSIVNVNGE